MRLHTSAFCLVLIASITPIGAGAATLDYAGIATVASSDFPTDIAVGDVFSFSFSYDDSIQDTSGSTVQGRFTQACSNFTLSSNTTNVGPWNPAGGQFGFCDVLTYSDRGLVTFWLPIPPDGGGFPLLGGSRFNVLEVWFLGVGINDTGTGNTLAQQLGGPLPTDLSAFTDAFLILGASGFVIAPITEFPAATNIPEPGSFWYGAAALGLLCLNWVAKTT